MPICTDDEIDFRFQFPAWVEPPDDNTPFCAEVFMEQMSRFEPKVQDSSEIIERKRRLTVSPAMLHIWNELAEIVGPKRYLLMEFYDNCTQALAFKYSLAEILTRDEIKKDLLSPLLNQTRRMIQLLDKTGVDPANNQPLPRIPGTKLRPSRKRPRYFQVARELLDEESGLSGLIGQLKNLEARILAYKPSPELLMPRLRLGHNPLDFRHNKVTHADIIVFVRTVSLFMREWVGKPAHSFVANVTNVVFNSTEMTDERVRKWTTDLAESM